MRMRTNIRRSFLTSALLTAVVLCSCQKDPLTPDLGNGGERKPGLNLSVSMLGAGGDAPDAQQATPKGGAPDSKAAVTDPATLAGTAAERTVKSLDLFLFDDDGAMVVHNRLTESGGNIGGVSSTLPATSSATWTNFDITTMVNAGGFGRRTLAVVANWDEAVMGGALKARLTTEGGSLSTLEQMVIEAPFTTASGSQTLPMAAPGLLMFGKSTPQSYVNTATIPAFEVDLVRMASRLDFKLHVSGAMAGATQVAEVRVMQAANKAYLGAPTTAAAGESTMPSNTAQSNSISGLFPATAINTTAESFSHTLYLPENNLRAGSYNRTNATYLLVNIPNGGSDNWYRFWANEADNRVAGTNNYHINRNTLYEIKAVISNKGGATPDDALETQDGHFGDVYYTVSYDVQPGMSGAPTIQRYRLGETITVADVQDMGAAGRDRYPVVLNTKADETGTVYYPGDTFTVTGHTTLFARLRPTAPRITLAEDGTLAITYDARDAGLLFKFGSVVGIYSDHHKNADLRGVYSTDTYDAGDVAFNPTGNTFAAWSDVPYASENVSIDHIYHTLANVLAGKGDPCRLVGLSQADIVAGNFDNGTWRLPTNAENLVFLGSRLSPTGHWWNTTSSPWGVVGGEFPNRDSQKTEAFAPAGGKRYLSIGTISDAGTTGHYWAADQDGLSGGYAIGFVADFAGRNVSRKPDAMSVRCVRQ